MKILCIEQKLSFSVEIVAHDITLQGTSNMNAVFLNMGLTTSHSDKPNLTYAQHYEDRFAA
jgi:hypothetical protein